MLTEVITQFYSSTGMEVDRLDQHIFQLEKKRSQEIIHRYLKPNMNIADIGGATGVYSFWLHDMGHNVHLLDATEFHVETATKISLAENKSLASIKLGDARDLPYEDEMFDMVLLFGPLYHLQKKEDRLKCISEAKRVLKTNGFLLAATISRYSPLYEAFWQGYIDDPDFEKILKEDLATGSHTNPTNHPMYFTDAYFHSLKEIDEEFTAAGFSNKGSLAIEGFGWLVPDFAKTWSNEIRKNKMLDYLRHTENDPVMIGMSAHVMTVAKKLETQ
jgi:ubiquinone/menaquinone biosynthesis C-methylase UbiE